MRLVHGRLAGVSVRASFGAGLWVGFTIGLVIGAVVGALRRTDRWVSVDMPLRASIRPTSSGGMSLTISRAF